MGMLVPRPSEVIKKFQALYQISPKEATDYFYKLSSRMVHTSCISLVFFAQKAFWITALF